MKNIIKIAAMAVAVITTTSCEKFLDVNENPNSPVTENLALSAKLPAALVTTVNQESNQLNSLGAQWGGYWGTTSEGANLFFKDKTYNGVSLRSSRDGTPIWENSYNNLLYYQLIKQQAQTEVAPFYLGIAKIMQAWHFMRLVDVYNNIPFDEALQGTKNPTPKYEDGKVVYEKSINMITEGIADIKSAVVNIPGNDDVLFKGNKTLWAKFGNTVKLRALVRQSQTNNQAYINSEIQKIVAEGSGFLGVGENAYVQPGYLNTAGKMNPFYESNYRDAGGATTANYANIRPTVFLINKYSSLNDPRLASTYVPVSGVYKGVLFGNPNVDNQYRAAATSAFRGPNENTNRPAGLFKSFNQPAVLLSSFESLFVQAEAAQRGWISGSAATLYENGIRESFKYAEVNAAEFAAYNAQASVSFSAASDKIERIIEQKWLAMNSTNSIEAWSDFRRLGFPAIPNSLLAPSPTARPLRLMYPETERQTNNAEATKQGGDEVTVDAVWWDK
jgi:hypothetical protein